MLKDASTRLGPRLLLAIIIVAAAFLYLIGNGRVSLWDRDEPRYAQCSRQMLDGFAGPGAHPPDFVVPHFLNDLRAEKPPLIYWLQAGAMKIFGENSFAARFPSATSMTAVLILIGVVLYQTLGGAMATWAVFVMATSGLTIMCAKMCLTDATLLLFSSIGQFCTYAVYRGNRSWKITLTLWAALGLGFLTKGPITLVPMGATLVALMIFDFCLDRKWNLKWWLTLRPWVGVLIIAAIFGPWALLVHHRDPTFLPRLISIGKKHLLAAQEKHTGPPGFYFATILGLYFPWCLIMPAALVIGFTNRRQPHIRYCLSVVFGVWVFQESMKTKLPFYILPIFPALAILTADAIIRCIRREYEDMHGHGFMVITSVFAGAVLVLGTVPWLLFGSLPRKFFHCEMYLGDLAPKGATILLSVIAVVYAATVFGLFRARRIAAGAIAMGIGVTAIFGVLFTAYLPNAQFMRTSERVAEILVNQKVAPGDGVMIDYKEPSLAFYTGGRLIEQSQNHFLELTPPAQWPTWIVMPQSLWNATPIAIREKLEIIGKPVRGIDYAGTIDKHTAVEVMVLKKKPG